MDGAGAGSGVERHGGNRRAVARLLGCRPGELLDASASLVPFGPPPLVRRALAGLLRHGRALPLVDYPDRSHAELRRLLALRHGLEPAWVLPGNGAAELFTWVGRDAAACGTSLLPTPGFADYRRALACWQGRWRPLPLPLEWPAEFPQPFPAGGSGAAVEGEVLWITQPHNPTGQLWSRASLEPLLARHALVIVDEAFLPLVPHGELQSLIPLVPHAPNLVVIRSLTKLCTIAGLRFGYAIASPSRLRCWEGWRDPWPVNGPAAAVAEALLADPETLPHWSRRVQHWVAREGAWLQRQLAAQPCLRPFPSAANFLLVRGERQGRRLSLEPLRLGLQQRHRILVRDCRSFEGLGEDWLRIGLRDRRGNRRLLRGLRQELPRL